MKLLLDTCTFLWFAADSPELSASARAAILDPGNYVYLSSISAWEIARKYARGKLKLPGRPESLIPAVRNGSGIEALPLSEDDALAAEKLPLHHGDPLDRMLIAQALMNGMWLVSPDRVFGDYPVRVLW
jgi:PIN domain nuclease of toxin-antitoxin system